MLIGVKARLAPTLKLRSECHSVCEQISSLTYLPESSQNFAVLQTVNSYTHFKSNYVSKIIMKSVHPFMQSKTAFHNAVLNG